MLLQRSHTYSSLSRVCRGQQRSLVKAVQVTARYDQRQPRPIPRCQEHGANAGTVEFAQSTSSKTSAGLSR